MKIIPELMPENSRYNVYFDDRLIGLDCDIDPADRNEVDGFWSTIYYMGLSIEAKAVLASDDYAVIDLVVHPTDYDVPHQEVGVVIAANILSLEESKVVAGPAVHARLDTQQKTMIDCRIETTYSSQYKAHVADLLAETALHYSPLETASM